MDPDTKVGVFLILNEESCDPLMVFVFQFNLKSPRPTFGKLFGLSKDPLVISCEPLKGNPRLGSP